MPNVVFTHSSLRFQFRLDLLVGHSAQVLVAERVIDDLDLLPFQQWPDDVGMRRPAMGVRAVRAERQVDSAALHEIHVAAHAINTVAVVDGEADPLLDSNPRQTWGRPAGYARRADRKATQPI